MFFGQAVLVVQTDKHHTMVHMICLDVNQAS